ncbi:CRAL-TRIO domain-containing protein [Ochromonadaceae sp. CCMP2298]|nr:CRAL-TRIO domain-containing protein [Ochromonadaceae sp. CCMP2298]
MATVGDIVIKSKDVDRTKFSDENLLKLKELYPSMEWSELARYLIARGSVEKATEQIQRALAWKDKNWPCLKSSCLTEISTGKLYVRGVDKEGRPLLIFRSRFSFPKKRNLEESARMLVFFAEHIVRALPDDLSKYTLLFDRTEHKGENTDMELMKHVASSFQDLFPERLMRTIIYPSDLLFYGVWNIAKWFLDPVTAEKVKPMMYFSGLEQFVDRKHIPKSMGGDDDYEFSPDDFGEPYSEEVLEAARAKQESAKETKPSGEEVPVTVFAI